MVKMDNENSNFAERVMFESFQSAKKVVDAVSDEFKLKLDSKDIKDVALAMFQESSENIRFHVKKKQERQGQEYEVPGKSPYM